MLVHERRSSRNRTPNNSLQLTRLAYGKLGVSCLPSCARMGPPLPEPPGS